MAKKDNPRPEYLVRDPSGKDYDTSTDFGACKRQADTLGPGSTVHPIKAGPGLVVGTQPGRTTPITLYVAK